MTAPFPWWEACIWGAVGGGLGVIALIAGWQEREKAHQTAIDHERSTAALRLEVASAKSFSEGAFTVVGRRLDSIAVQAQVAGNSEIRSEVSQLKAELDFEPKLFCEIKVVTTLVADDPANWSDVFFDILIRNTGKPTAIADWGANYRTPEGKPVYVPDFAFSREPNSKIGNNLLLDDRVIPEGGFRSGYVMLRLPNDEARKVSNKRKGDGIAINFGDVDGKHYVMTWPPLHYLLESGEPRE
jgi:hypothetical protein